MNLIVSLAPTGIVPTKEMNPETPISVEEIVEDVLRCDRVGITMVHLHARDEEGRPTHRGDVYARIIEGIRKYAPELVLCVSLSGRAAQDYDKRSEPLRLNGIHKPDMGSLTLSSLNFPGQASLNPPETVKALAAEMLKRRILPEIEIFDLGMANYMKYLIQKDLLQPPFYVNVFLGGIAGAQLDLAHAGLLIKDLPEGTLWSMAGLGNAQLGANLLGMAVGGGVRTGLEDMVYTDESRKLLATNFFMVERIHMLAEHLEREIMTPGEFRHRFDLKPGRGAYGF